MMSIHSLPPAFYQVPEPPAGELELLRWIIVILITVIVSLAGVIAYMYTNHTKRELEIRKEYQERLDSQAEKFAAASTIFAETARAMSASNNALGQDIKDMSIALNLVEEMRKVALAAAEEVKSGRRDQRNSF